MLGVYDFCGHYEWTFEWLRQAGGEELVHDYWEEAISHDSQRHARDLIFPNGFAGMQEYWGRTLDEEGAKCVITPGDEVFRVDMHECPSKGFLLRNNLEQYHDYCNHCIGWIGPLLKEAGFRVDHQHNHMGQCWWEMRLADDTRPDSAVSEIAGADDIRLNVHWKETAQMDSFFHEPNDDISPATVQQEHIVKPMMTTKFFTALVTPLHDDDSLHAEGLEQLITRQLEAGIKGLLPGGTMGAMQLQSDATYRDLMNETMRLAAGKCEVLAGAGDASFARTRDRIAFLNTLPVDGVVVLAPYLMTFSQDELVDYYRALADFSKTPLFLYDLPQLTRCKLEAATVQKLATHPNIAGIKCSDEPGYARQLCDTIDDTAFRIILAAPTLVDVFLRSGFHEHLDGVFCLCPQQVVEIGQALVAGDEDRAAQLQQGINRLLRLLLADGVWRPCTALLHEMGIAGRFKPHPHRDWDEKETQEFLQREETQAVLKFMCSGANS